MSLLLIFTYEWVTGCKMKIRLTQSSSTEAGIGLSLAINSFLSPKPLVLLLVAGLSQSSPQISSNQVVRTVTTQLQPLISDAVAAALRGASGGLGSATGAASGGLSEQEEAEYNKKLVRLY